MVGLNCGSVSAIALPDMRAGIDAFCAVEDDAVSSAVRMLLEDDLTCGETGAAGGGGRAGRRGRGGARRAARGVGRGQLDAPRGLGGAGGAGDLHRGADRPGILRAHHGRIRARAGGLTQRGQSLLRHERSATGMNAISATTCVTITNVSTDATEWPYSAPI